MNQTAKNIEKKLFGVLTELGKRGKVNGDCKPFLIISSAYIE